MLHESNHWLLSRRGSVSLTVTQVRIRIPTLAAVAASGVDRWPIESIGSSPGAVTHAFLAVTAGNYSVLPLRVDGFRLIFCSPAISAIDQLITGPA